MAHFKIKKGLDLKVAGKAAKNLDTAPVPETVAIHPTEFHGIKPKLYLKADEQVKGGEPLFFDKKNPSVKFVSPVPGTITAINYGERRCITSIVIKPDWDGPFIDFGAKTNADIEKMSREDVVSLLQESGNFTYIRQRPFDGIPDASRVPKAIFINGMNTAPNAGDSAFMLDGRTEDIQLGVAILKKLTDGKINLCYSSKGSNDIFQSITDVEKHTFSGPHPSGLVGTHIHYINPINKGDIVWYLDAEHVAAIGAFLKTGKFYNEKVACVAGTGIKTPQYYKTKIGASIKSLIGNDLLPDEQRIVSGTVLFGDKVTPEDHLKFYDPNVQVIPEGRKRRFFGWAMPGFNMFSASSRAFASSIIPRKEWKFDTSLKGGVRTVVWTDVYDNVIPLDIYTNFLIKAILADEIEDTEMLGILEVSDEDFALATYLCPSKVDVSSIIRQGLDILEKEGY